MKVKFDKQKFMKICEGSENFVEILSHVLKRSFEAPIPKMDELIEETIDKFDPEVEVLLAAFISAAYMIGEGKRK